MSTAIERFKKRQSMMAASKSPIKELTTTQKKDLVNEAIDEEFVNSPMLYSKEIKTLNEGLTKINNIARNKK